MGCFLSSFIKSERTFLFGQPVSIPSSSDTSLSENSTRMFFFSENVALLNHLTAPFQKSERQMLDMLTVNIKCQVCSSQKLMGYQQCHQINHYHVIWYTIADIVF